MDLQKLADEAMEYLDSLGVAAEYEIDEDGPYGVVIITDSWSFQFLRHLTVDKMIKVINKQVKQKSPN